MLTSMAHEEKSLSSLNRSVVMGESILLPTTTVEGERRTELEEGRKLEEGTRNVLLFRRSLDKGSP